MEYEELKSMWEKYNLKLDNLERLNKKLIVETLLRKPQKKLNWFKYLNLYSLIVPPVILIVALHPLLKVDNIDNKFTIGSILLISGLAYSIFFCIKSILALKKIDLQNDSVIESLEKINKFKNILNIKPLYLYSIKTILFASILLIGWNGFDLDFKTILLIIILLVFVIIWGNKKSKIFKNKIERFEKDIMELKEYKE